MTPARVVALTLVLALFAVAFGRMQSIRAEPERFACHLRGGTPDRAWYSASIRCVQ